MLATAVLPEARPPALSGALNLYSLPTSQLALADRDLALLLATHASLALAHTSAVHTGEIEKGRLHTAIESRDVVGQAKGILTARRGISADEAFDGLRGTSQHLNVKLVQPASPAEPPHTWSLGVV